MSNDNKLSIKYWSVRNILENRNSLGIPHFQRGLVWNNDNIALLLESLYFDTPCGNIVLWENPDKDNATKHGIPLFKSSERIEYFIIDGQQRTRSLCGVFDEIDRSLKMDADGEVPYVWAANLAAFAEVFAQEEEKFKNLFVKGRVDSLFVKVKDPVLQKKSYIQRIIDKINNGKKSNNLSPEYQNQYNFVPLSLLFGNNFSLANMVKENFAELKDEYKKGKDKKSFFEKLRDDISNNRNLFFIKFKQQADESLLPEFFEKLQNGLKNIRERKFPVHILGTENMSDIIHTYIRINSGGRAVQQEEKTIARLVQLCPEIVDKEKEAQKGTFSIIRELFNEIHPDEGSDNINDHFKRAKENQFGFRLFVRVFVMAANYHTGWALGSQSMSFSAIENNEALERVERNKILEIWEVVKQVTLAVKDLLEHDLHLDTLAFLPDSRSLWPVFMILIKHPDFISENKIKQGYRPKFAYILLTLLLGSGDSEKTIVGLMKQIREFYGDGNKLINSLINNSFNDLWKGIVDNCQKDKLKTKFGYANAMNNRYILLLYALERHLECEDFHGASLPENLRSKFSENRKISAELFPEKQHIVPYSTLHKNDEDAELYKGRKSNDLANNIGNLTYISRQLNHYETGLGSQWLILNKDQNQSELNKGHIISKDAIEKFTAARDEDELNVSNQKYKDWIEQRQKDIAAEFCSWLNDLKGTPEEKTSEDIIPHARLLILPEKDAKGTQEFIGLAYLAEVWQNSEWNKETKEEQAKKFILAGTKLRLTDGEYTVVERKK